LAAIPADYCQFPVPRMEKFPTVTAAAVVVVVAVAVAAAVAAR
jgi:hypothetical protein